MPKRVLWRLPDGSIATRHVNGAGVTEYRTKDGICYWVGAASGRLRAIWQENESGSNYGHDTGWAQSQITRVE